MQVGTGFGDNSALEAFVNEKIKSGKFEEKSGVMKPVRLISMNTWSTSPSSAHESCRHPFSFVSPLYSPSTLVGRVR